MNTENIKLFIQTNYSDYQLAALIEHTESGKLSFKSCCCLIGIPTAPHALRVAGEYEHIDHFFKSYDRLPYAQLAHTEFDRLGGPEWSDSVRRERLLPILYEEKDRRLELWTEKDTDQALTTIGFPR